MMRLFVTKNGVKEEIKREYAAEILGREDLNEQVLAYMIHGGAGFVTSAGTYTIEPECDLCGGTGEIAMDQEDGEGHTMSGVETRKCVCQNN